MVIRRGERSPQCCPNYPPTQQSLPRTLPPSTRGILLTSWQVKGNYTSGDEVQSVKVGDTILIPANMVHQIRNLATSRENLVFIAVCVPAWTVNCSVFLDE
ncbi:MAG UNVERIFIED_CONTAM: hypothetical protein LVT10_07315 [Anaerolineae bacterium]